VEGRAFGGAGRIVHCFVPLGGLGVCVGGVGRGPIGGCHILGLVGQGSVPVVVHPVWCGICRSSMWRSGRVGCGDQGVGHRLLGAVCVFWGW